MASAIKAQPLDRFHIEISFGIRTTIEYNKTVPKLGIISHAN